MHFTLGVIIPNDVEPCFIEDYLHDALEPFDENLDVPPHPVPCECAGLRAKMRAVAYANTVVGDVTWSNPLWPEWQETWQDRMNYDPDQYAVNPDCEDCHGTGIRQSTWNPRAKWDWWVIGGRWNGRITDTDLPNPYDLYPKLPDLYGNVTHIGQDLLKRDKPYIPFAVLSPDGNWNQDEWDRADDDDTWRNTVVDIYTHYADNLLVLVDYHS